MIKVIAITDEGKRSDVFWEHTKLRDVLAKIIPEYDASAVSVSGSSLSEYELDGSLQDMAKGSVLHLSVLSKPGTGVSLDMPDEKEMPASEPDAPASTDRLKETQAVASAMWKWILDKGLHYLPLVFVCFGIADLVLVLTSGPYTDYRRMCICLLAEVIGMGLAWYLNNEKHSAKTGKGKAKKEEPKKEEPAEDLPF